MTQSCLTLCNLMDCSPPSSSVRGILQARIMEWVAICFSRGSSWPRDWIWVSCIAGRFFTVWDTRVACNRNDFLLFMELYLYHVNSSYHGSSLCGGCLGWGEVIMLESVETLNWKMSLLEFQSILGIPQRFLFKKVFCSHYKIYWNVWI